MDKAITSPKTLQEAVIHFANYENCHAFMMNLRWPDGKVLCPTCGSDDVAYLPNARVFKCYQKHARQKFSLKVGTIFEDSPIGLDKWLPVMWMLVNSKNGISSWEVHRAVGVTQKTAWFMLQRVRLAMQDENYAKLSGTIEADETYIGGKAANMHLDKLTRLKMQGHARAGTDGKSIVAGLLERDGKAKVKVVPTTRAYHIRTNVIENVEKGSTVYSDSLLSYRNLPVDGFIHDFVNHTERYVNGQVHTNGLENFWSLLKRSIKGTYVSVEPFHLQAYCDEQVFRYNNRGPMTDADRFNYVMRKIHNKRITYKELTGKTEKGPKPEEEPF